MAARRRSTASGLTMVEIMVSVGLVGIAAAFTFSIQVRSSSAFKDQATISEMQQTLRAASDMLVRDVRQAGYLATNVGVTSSTIQGVQGTDNVNGDGTDMLTIVYADETAEAKISQGQNPPCNSAESTVDSTTGFTDGDVVMAVRTSPCTDNRTNPATVYPIGSGCVLAITQVQTGAMKIQHNPGAGAPWNMPGNSQCDALCNATPTTPGCWSDGHTVFVKVVIRSYRIKPNDQRGILQMSPSGTRVANDWVDLAVGIVDLQVAIRKYQQGDNTDDDGDGDKERDWYSGANMATSTGVPTYVSLTLVAKTTKEVNSALPIATPDVRGSTAKPDNNSMGNHAPTTLPVADTASPYYGNYLYRMYTTTVDLRNIGVGK